MFILPIEEARPPKKFPFINLLLIGVNLYVFYRTGFSSHFEQLIWRYGFIPAHPHFRDAFSSMFMHAGLLHLFGNMYFLYVFGGNVEDRLGHLNYLITYFLCGSGAVFLQFWAAPHSMVPMIGASGAISGVCALYMVMFPWNKMRLQFFFLIFPLFSIPMRAIFVVGLWFLIQYLMAVGTPVGSGGVAFWAHVGGFLTGLLAVPFMSPGKRR